MATPQISPREELLLRAAIDPNGERAEAAWLGWASQTDLESAPFPELRILTPAYAHLTRVAPELRFPDKIRGKARATFTINNLMAHECLPIVEELSSSSPVLVVKGLAFCIRFNAWSSRVMGDVDIQVLPQSLDNVCSVLADAGWNPKFGMTWASLAHRSSLRRNSWNVTKGVSKLDIHWRLMEGPEETWLTRAMWASAEPGEFLGRTVLIQSPEFALVSSLNHGFNEGTHADGLQTVIDCAELLPRCRRDFLYQLLNKTGLISQWEDLLSILEKLGLSELSATTSDLRDRQPRMFSESSRSPMPAAAPKTETAVLRHPALYRVWEAVGRSSWLERLLVKLAGPFSKPLAFTGAFKEDYDLRDCAVIDEIAGPGWSWPEPEHTCFWSDRGDARLLLPLGAKRDYLLAIGIAEHGICSPNGRVAVFANGTYLTMLDFTARRATSEYCVFIPKHLLFGPWVELSLRPHPYRGEESSSPSDYSLKRSVPIRRVRIFDMGRTSEIFSGYSVPDLYFGILHEEEPQASKFSRIRERIEKSTFRSSSKIPTDFNPVLYVLSYPDLFEAEVDPYEHFVLHGREEGREWH